MAENPGPNEKDGPTSGGTENLFTSVWVKVERNDGENEETSENTLHIKVEPADPMTDGDFGETIGTEKQQRKPRKTHPQKHVSLHCNQCDYQCSSKQALNAHSLKHSTNKPHKCSHCDYKTKYPLSLKRHEFVQHVCKVSEAARENLPTYKCSKCEYTTNFKWNLRAHFRKHDLPKKYQCPYCSFSTAYKHNHDKHSRVHSKQTLALYSCDKCPFTTRYEGHIVRHLAKIHLEISEKASRCKQCSFTSRIKWRLNLHMNRSREDKAMYCPICNYETNFRCAFKEHKKTHIERNQINHRWIENQFKQQGTEEPVKELPSAANEDGLVPEKQSSQTYEKSKNYDIDSNGVETSSIDSKVNDLRNKYVNDSYFSYNPNPQSVEVNYPQIEQDHDNHYRLDPTCEVEWKSIQVLELPNEDRPFQCITCSYKAKYKASVQRHYQRLHTSHNRPYICVKCEFSTKTKDQISLHIKRSKSQALLTCKICNFSTFFKCQYTIHEKVHLPYRCLLCEFACKKKHEVQIHFSIVHLGNGLKCSQCEFVTTRKETLLIHESTHSGTKPYSCELCPYSATRRQLLLNHLVRIHKKDSEEKVLDESKIALLRTSVDISETVAIP